MDIRTFVMLGRPGSGKGTQAKLLAESLGAKLYASGAEVRKAAHRKTVLGTKIKEMTERGDLVPHWFISHLFVDILQGLDDDALIVLDGFCRKDSEAKLFDEVATFLGRKYIVIYLDVSKKEVMERLAKRRDIEKRKDDDESSIGRRFEEFDNETTKSLDYYKACGNVIDIDGTGTPEEIFKRIQEKVKSL